MTDADQFEAFVRRHQHLVYGVAVRLLGTPADAEDVAQTVFLKAFERFDEIGRSPAAAAWLRTVTTNLALNHLTRYRARRRLFSEMTPAADDPGPRTFEETIPGGQSPLEVLEAADQHSRVEEALRRLPDHQRVPLVLFHFEQVSYQEIAGRLGVSLAKIKTDIFRARDALRRALGDGDDDE
jgi:RNA polymerase sigma-70 factor (ECF subfamily)